MIKNTFYVNPSNGVNDGVLTVGVPKTTDTVDKETIFEVQGGGIIKTIKCKQKKHNVGHLNIFSNTSYCIEIDDYDIINEINELHVTKLITKNNIKEYTGNRYDLYLAYLDSDIYNTIVNLGNSLFLSEIAIRDKVFTFDDSRVNTILRNTTVESNISLSYNSTVLLKNLSDTNRIQDYVDAISNWVNNPIGPIVFLFKNLEDKILMINISI